MFATQYPYFLMNSDQLRVSLRHLHGTGRRGLSPFQRPDPRTHYCTGAHDSKSVTPPWQLALCAPPSLVISRLAAGSLDARRDAESTLVTPLNKRSIVFSLDVAEGGGATVWVDGRCVVVWYFLTIHTNHLLTAMPPPPEKYDDGFTTIPPPPLAVFISPRA